MQADFTQLPVIPNFDKLVNCVTLMLYSAPRLEQILIINLLSTLFNQVIQPDTGFKEYQEYYMIKLLQTSTLGLQSKSIELKAAFLTFFFEVLEAAEKREEFKTMLQNQMKSVLYGLLSTDIDYPLLSA